MENSFWELIILILLQNYLTAHILLWTAEVAASS